jgi:DNA-binding transcriptional ArsR family regulator
MSLDDGTPPVPELRRITDARTMRALSHPVRIAIIEVLSLEGPMTATEVGERIGESPTTCSFHLRQLAKYGFVEEAGGGKGRARPWRMASIGMSLDTDDNDDAETKIAHEALSALIRDRVLDRYRKWLVSRASYPKPWRDAANESEWVFYLTAEELNQLNKDVSNMLLARFPERLVNPTERPAGSVPVEMLMVSFPVSPPAQGNDEAD